MNYDLGFRELGGLGGVCRGNRHLRFGLTLSDFFVPEVQGSGFRVQGSGCRVQGVGCRVQSSECRVQGVVLRVEGLGCWV